MRIFCSAPKLHITQRNKSRNTPSFCLSEHGLIVAVIRYLVISLMEHFPAISFARPTSPACWSAAATSRVAKRACCLPPARSSPSLRRALVLPYISMLNAARRVARILQRTFLDRTSTASGWSSARRAMRRSRSTSRLPRKRAANLSATLSTIVDNCSFITPAIVDRSPVIVAVSSGGSAPVLPEAYTRATRTVLLPARLGALAESCARVSRARSKSALQTLQQALAVLGAFLRRIAVAGETYAGRSTWRGKRCRISTARYRCRQRRRSLAGRCRPRRPGVVDAQCIAGILQRADVILHDRLVSADILAFARRDATMISVGKTPGCTVNSQDAKSTNALVESGGRGQSRRAPQRRRSVHLWSWRRRGRRARCARPALARDTRHHRCRRLCGRCRYTR